jgi:transcriptional regulator with XRE-family HTH domain
MSAEQNRRNGARLRATRKARELVVADLAERIRDMAPDHIKRRLPKLRDIERTIRGHEAGDHNISERYRMLYARALDIDESELFGSEAEHAEAGDDLAVLPLLVERDTPLDPPVIHPGRFTVEGVEALLRRLYRLDAEFGGNELCLVIADQVQAAAGLFNAGTLKAATERRLFGALAGLTQIAGWLSHDANHHADANRYLATTVYAAHEIDDLGLAGHALGYMSLDAFYRDQPSKALALAEAASDLARAGGTPRTVATLHHRAARAHARLGEADVCKRRLDSAHIAYLDDQPPDEEPQWVAYVSEYELAAQRGACFLDLGMSDEAIAALQEALELVRTTSPDHHRDLAHYKTRLASAYLLKSEPGEAARTAAEAYEINEQIGSARVNERFMELIARLQAEDVPEARDLVERVMSR